MDENINNVELEESVEMVDEGDTSKMDNDELKNAIEAQMRKLRTQSMLMGAQSVCQVILQKIITHKAKPGKKSYRDFERLVDDIEQFCRTGISRQVNADGTVSAKTEAEDSTVQNY